MSKLLLTTAGFLALAAAGPTWAQARDTVPSDVRGYLCTFAGKCGPDGVGETPTMAAPATKGFRLATAQGAMPSADAPRTRGFRLASGQQASGRAAAASRGYRLTRATASHMTPGRRAYAATVRPAMTSGAARTATAAPRADLMLPFAYNSAEMTAAVQARARGFAQALLMPDLQGKRFLIEGHTDARGPRALNLDLSQRRAQSVADFLVAQGVDRSRVEVRGVGPDEPLPGRSAKAQANRRVEAVLLS